MNILFVVATEGWGGVKTWALETASVLARRGHRCVMVGSHGNPWVAACHAAGLPARSFRFGPYGNPVVALRLALLARRMAADVLVVNNHRDLVAGCLAGALARRPVVRRDGRPDDFSDTRLERFLYRRFLAGLLAVGHRAKAEMLSRCPWLTAASIAVIHIGKDTERYRPGAGDGVRHQWSFPSDGVVFGVTSQLVRRKGHGVLLDALARVAPVDPRVCLAVVGTGDERPAIEQRIRELRLDDRVRLLGFRRDLPRVLASLDAFVLPSLREAEAFPNSLVEAMATGLPSIVTDVGCVREIANDGLEALLVVPGDVADLAEAIQRLAADATLRQRLGAQARRRVQREFALEAKVMEIEHYLAGIR